MKKSIVETFLNKFCVMRTSSNYVYFVYVKEIGDETILLETPTKSMALPHEDILSLKEMNARERETYLRKRNNNG